MQALGSNNMFQQMEKCLQFNALVYVQFLLNTFSVNVSTRLL